MTISRVGDLESNSTSFGSSGHAVNVKEETWLSQFRNGSNPWMARYVYGMMFLVANLLAWVARDYGRGALTEISRLKGCQGARDCLGAEGVLRVSLGCFTFYMIMFLSTVGNSKLHNRRDSWHSGWWTAKIVLLTGLMIPSSSLLQLFSYTERLRILEPGIFYSAVYSPRRFFPYSPELMLPARKISGPRPNENRVFLLIQLISVISFITWLNECCQSDENAERCHVYVMLFATATYLVCFVGVILMYIWYAPEASCLLNIFFITWTLVLLQLMTSVSLHPKINAGFLAPGLMGLYIMFICWCAIRSEPAGESCNRKAEASNRTDWLTIISFVVALLAMVIATFSTGIDSQSFQFRKKDIRAEDDVPYGYGFFHFVFATGAMYFAMLLIGWNTHHAMKKWTIDVGWTSTWIRIVNEWVAVCVYLWMLVAPLVWKNRQQTRDST